MTNLVDADGHAIPFEPGERDGLIPTHISLRSELNELEQRNIAATNRWAFGRRRDVLGHRFLKGLYRRMFKRVWKWAGEYRATERNLGVKPYFIETKLHQAIDDAKYWIENKSYPPDERAVRFHHRIVCVHPWFGHAHWTMIQFD